MPLRIALVGAPGSGKTELAQQIKQALDKDVAIVDRYVQNLGDRTNIAFDHYGNHFANAMVLTERVAAELAEREHEAVVTCGSLIETTIYSAIFALSNADTGVGQVNLINDKRAQVAMTWLGMAVLDTWNYDFAFYCPHDGQDHWQGIVDEYIPEAIESLQVAVVTLPKDRPERIAKVLETIASYEWEAESEDADAEATEE